MWIERVSEKIMVLFYFFEGEPEEKQLSEKEENAWDVIIKLGVKKLPQDVPKTAGAFAEFVNTNIQALKKEADGDDSNNAVMEFYAYLDPDMKAELKSAVKSALRLLVPERVQIIERADKI